MDEMELRKGWKYIIKGAKDETVQGTFLGYSMIGSETAMVMDCDEGMTYVPISKIHGIILSEKGEEEPAAKKKEEPGVYYG